MSYIKYTLLYWIIVTLVWFTFSFSSAYANEAQDQQEVRSRVLQLQTPDAWLPWWVSDQKWLVWTLLSRLFNNEWKVKKIFLSELLSWLTWWKIAYYDAATEELLDSAITSSDTSIWVWWPLLTWYVANFTWDVNVVWNINVTDDPDSWDNVMNRDYADTRYINVWEPINGDDITDGTIDGSEIEDNSLTADDIWENAIWNSEMIDSPSFSGKITAENGFAVSNGKVISWNWNEIQTRFEDNTRYGYFSVRNDSSQRGAYFGYGNGWDTVNLWLDQATILSFGDGGSGNGAILDMNNHPIQFLPLPVNSWDAVNKSYVDTAVASAGDGDSWGVTWEDVLSNIQRDGNVAIGSGAGTSDNITLNLQKNPSVDTTTRQLYSDIVATSPLLTADRTTYGAQFNVTNNKTEDIWNGRDSDAIGVYWYTETTGTNTFRSNKGLQWSSYNYSTASSWLWTLYWAQGTAWQLADSGNIANMYGVLGVARWDTTSSTTSSVSNAYGLYGDTYPYRSNITNGYGLRAYARTNNGYEWNMTNAYGIFASVNDGSDDGGAITTARAGYFTTSRIASWNLMNTAYGVQIDANDASTVYGLRIDTDDTDPSTNYGLWIDSVNATSDNYWILWERGDWYLQEDGDGWVGGTGDGWDFLLWTDADLRMWHDGTDSHIRNYTWDLYIGDDGNDDIILSDNGWRVGIGISSPSETLDINWNARATAFYYSSDRSLKSDISTIDNPLDIVSKIRGVDFKWKENQKKDIGFIAQELEAIIPELVTTDENTGLKSVQYWNIVAIAVEAIKKQQTEIDNLKWEIEAIKKLLKD